jgi:hypothetical protein
MILSVCFGVTRPSGAFAAIDCHHLLQLAGANTLGFEAPLEPKKGIVVIEDDIVTRGGKKPSKGDVRYEASRGLLDYVSRFSGSSFDLLTKISQMDGLNVITDLGSGEGHFSEQVYLSPKKVFKTSNLGPYSSQLNWYIRRFWHPRRGVVDEPGSIDPLMLSESNVPLEEVQRRYLNVVRLQEILDRPANQKPGIVAITYEMQRAAPDLPRVKFLTGRKFEEIRDEEIPLADLSISNIGIPSYTPNMTEALAKMIRRTRVGGQIIIAGCRAVLLKDSEVLEDFDKVEKQNVVKTRTLTRPNLDRSFLFFERLGGLSNGISVVFDSVGQFYIVTRLSEDFVIPQVIFEGSYGNKETPPTHLFRLESGKR